jgi:serine/threonine-protein kinase
MRLAARERCALGARTALEASDMALKEGDILAGKYRIERMLGEGGMGSVYVAENQVLQKRVALKVMSQRFTALPTAVERFVREAVAASRVSHPSIVQVFDAGQHDGAPWIAMELLNGESLGQRLERGPLSVAEALKVADGVLSALAEVHDEGIVHRDLKPDNIFLATTRSGEWTPKILDFGVAKDTGDELNKLTATGAVVGTAHYISPEQARGVGDIDARADVYAMGVVLFESLSGRMPYDAPTLTQLIAKMFTEAPQRLEDVAPHVPKPISDAVQTCLEQDRAKRFQTARALLGALRAASDASGFAVSMPSPAPRSSAPVRTPSPFPATAHGTPSMGAGSMGGAPVGSVPTGHAPIATAPTHLAMPSMSAPGTPLPTRVTAPTMDAAPPFPSAVSQPALAEPARASRLGLVLGLAAVFVLGALGTGAAWVALDEGSPTEPVASAPAAPSVAEPTALPTPAPPAPATSDATPEPSPTPPTSEAPAAAPSPEPSRPSRAQDERRDVRADPATPPAEPVAAPEPQAEPAPSEPPVVAEPAPEPVVRERPREDRRDRNRLQGGPEPAPTATQGGLPQAAILSTIQQRAVPQVRQRCQRPGVQGFVTVAWTVLPTGQVAAPHVVRNGTGDEWLGRCAAQVVAETRFPAASNGQTTPARYPFQFQ